MNSTGKELTQADLIRNFILMGLDIKEQSYLYEHYWRPMETNFGQEAYNTDFDGFMRHYLTVKTGKIPRINEVYEAFKEYAAQMASKEISISMIVADIRKFSKFYCNMALKLEPDADLRKAFADVKELRVDVAYPMLLEVYSDYSSGDLSKDHFIELLRLVEAYVFRRNICSIPTNSLNKTFATFMKTVDRARYMESIKAQFILLPSYRRFPNDDEFVKELKTRDLYNIPRRSYWFKKMENYGRKEQLDVDQYTIEHIMPQNPDLSDEWKIELGPEWDRIQKTWLHTIGNLTLTGYNVEYSDKPFSKKRDCENGFRDSPIRLNQSLRSVKTWDEQAIMNRALALSAIATQVWAAPILSEEIIDQYRPRPAAARSSYTIDDYPNLSPTSSSYSKEVRELFDTLQKAILAIDPVVTVDYLKLYIAFKAETNFVDVVPQLRRLRLTLNMRFAEIIDPRGLCKDVTNLGRWGNGDVEIGFSSLEDFPYVLGLIRQSFDYQMNGST